MASRGDAVSGYLPPFADGAKVYVTNMKYQIVTGTVTSANVTYAKTHSLGATPSLVMVIPLFAAADLGVSATQSRICGESRASAATSTNFYVRSNYAGVKFRAFLML